ncbi:hypothetical protein ABPG74_013728 [Tetrahymena malaccensis]
MSIINKKNIEIIIQTMLTMLDDVSENTVSIGSIQIDPQYKQKYFQKMAQIIQQKNQNQNEQNISSSIKLPQNQEIKCGNQQNRRIIQNGSEKKKEKMHVNKDKNYKKINLVEDIILQQQYILYQQQLIAQSNIRKTDLGNMSQQQLNSQQELRQNHSDESLDKKSESNLNSYQSEGTKANQINASNQENSKIEAIQQNYISPKTFENDKQYFEGNNMKQHQQVKQHEIEEEEEKEEQKHDQNAYPYLNQNYQQGNYLSQRSPNTAQNISQDQKQISQLQQSQGFYQPGYYNNHQQNQQQQIDRYHLNNYQDNNQQNNNFNNSNKYNHFLNGQQNQYEFYQNQQQTNQVQFQIGDQYNTVSNQYQQEQQTNYGIQHNNQQQYSLRMVQPYEVQMTQSQIKQQGEALINEKIGNNSNSAFGQFDQYHNNTVNNNYQQCSQSNMQSYGQEVIQQQIKQQTDAYTQQNIVNISDSAFDQIEQPLQEQQTNNEIFDQNLEQYPENVAQFYGQHMIQSQIKQQTIPSINEKIENKSDSTFDQQKQLNNNEILNKNQQQNSEGIIQYYEQEITQSQIKQETDALIYEKMEKNSDSSFDQQKQLNDLEILNKNQQQNSKDINQCQGQEMIQAQIQQQTDALIDEKILNRSDSTLDQTEQCKLEQQTNNLILNKNQQQYSESIMQSNGQEIIQPQIKQQTGILINEKIENTFDSTFEQTEQQKFDFNNNYKQEQQKNNLHPDQYKQDLICQKLDEKQSDEIDKHGFNNFDQNQKSSSPAQTNIQTDNIVQLQANQHLDQNQQYGLNFIQPNSLILQQQQQPLESINQSCQQELKRSNSQHKDQAIVDQSFLQNQIEKKQEEIISQQFQNQFINQQQQASNYQDINPLAISNVDEQQSELYDLRSQVSLTGQNNHPFGLTYNDQDSFYQNTDDLQLSKFQQQANEKINIQSEKHQINIQESIQNQNIQHQHNEKSESNQNSQNQDQEIVRIDISSQRLDSNQINYEFGNISITQNQEEQSQRDFSLKDSYHPNGQAKINYVNIYNSSNVQNNQNETNFQNLLEIQQRNDNNKQAYPKHEQISFTNVYPGQQPQMNTNNQDQAQQSQYFNDQNNTQYSMILGSLNSTIKEKQEFKVNNQELQFIEEYSSQNEINEDQIKNDEVCSVFQSYVTENYPDKDIQNVIEQMRLNYSYNENRLNLFQKNSNPNIWNCTGPQYLIYLIKYEKIITEYLQKIEIQKLDNKEFTNITFVVDNQQNLQYLQNLFEALESKIRVYSEQIAMENQKKNINAMINHYPFRSNMRSQNVEYFYNKDSQTLHWFSFYLSSEELKKKAFEYNQKYIFKRVFIQNFFVEKGINDSSMSRQQKDYLNMVSINRNKIVKKIIQDMKYQDSLSINLAQLKKQDQNNYKQYSNFITFQFEQINLSLYEKFIKEIKQKISCYIEFVVQDKSSSQMKGKLIKKDDFLNKNLNGKYQQKYIHFFDLNDNYNMLPENQSIVQKLMPYHVPINGIFIVDASSNQFISQILL